jgi:hypothetical protein
VFHIANKAVGDAVGFIEPASLIAFIVYGVVGGLVLAVLNGVFSRRGFGRGGILHRA